MPPARQPSAGRVRGAVAGYGDLMPVRELPATLVRGSIGEMFEAAEALGRAGALTVVFVAPLLHADDAATRRGAAIALERIGAPFVEAAFEDDPKRSRSSRG